MGEAATPPSSPGKTELRRRHGTREAASPLPATAAAPGPDGTPNGTAAEAGDGEDPKQKKTYGRTPDGTGT